MAHRMITVDANEAVASVAHRTNEVIVIYPITPSSPMAEWCDEWSANGRKNVWGQIPDITQMQSEAGVIAALHGALQAGSLATTFTASQGLLLMIPNMYKIAGELTSFCMHVAARTVAAHALSIFGDHSDVMAVRQTGFALLCSNSAQEAHDFALIAQAATLKSRIPFLHFFDGFRTSHEVAKIQALADDDLRAMFDDVSIAKHRKRALTPDHPVLHGTERQNYDFFLNIPDPPRDRLKLADVKGSQFLLPMFEYSGACSGCGETPYLKLLTQLLGDRLLIANATGCSSIYGGNLPSTPYTTNPEGRGPAWSNSLFEDNAEFGLGFRLSLDFHIGQARALLAQWAGEPGEPQVREILEADQKTEEGINAQRRRVALLRDKLRADFSPLARRLELLVDYLVEKSVWIVGGDGWAYDIGFGGLDHVLSLDRKVHVLVLDTEVYSNTGGQASKSTPIGAAAKFASSGKSLQKKDLGLIAMSYGHVYVASVAFGAKDTHTVQAFQEAASYDALR